MGDSRPTSTTPSYYLGQALVSGVYRCHKISCKKQSHRARCSTAADVDDSSPPSTNQAIRGPASPVANRLRMAPPLENLGSPCCCKNLSASSDAWLITLHLKDFLFVPPPLRGHKKPSLSANQRFLKVGALCVCCYHKESMAKQSRFWP